MTNKPSITIFMAIYNEAEHIRAAYQNAAKAVREAGIDDYEIILSTVTNPDGSHDGAPEIAAEIAKNDKNVKHLAIQGLPGFGIQYQETLKIAAKDYIMMLPGDNDNIYDSIVHVLRHVGKAPLVVVYTQNPEARPFRLRFASKSFVALCNLLFGLKLKYYNGTSILPVKWAKMVPFSAKNPAYAAEMLIHLIKSGAPYIEIPQIIRYTPYAGKTFRMKSVFQALGTLASIFWQIHFKRVRLILPPIRHQ
ncbi:MAG: glycosyltransferase [Patescibacteria group bacterium]